MTHNELRKGTEVFLLGGRKGKLLDNKKGIIRCVQITEGGYPEAGSVYVWEIHSAILPGSDTIQPVALSSAHAKKRKVIQACGF